MTTSLAVATILLSQFQLYGGFILLACGTNRWQVVPAWNAIDDILPGGDVLMGVLSIIAGALGSLGFTVSLTQWKRAGRHIAFWGFALGALWYFIQCVVLALALLGPLSQSINPVGPGTNFVLACIWALIAYLSTDGAQRDARHPE